MTDPQRPDVDALRALTGAATPGEWRAEGPVIYGTDGMLAETGFGLPTLQQIPDAQFIVAARNALPVLLAHVSRLEAVAEAARAEVLARGYRSTDMARAMETLWGEFWFETYVVPDRVTCGWSVTTEMDDGPSIQRCVLPPHPLALDHRFGRLAALDTSVVVPDADGGQS